MTGNTLFTKIFVGFWLTTVAVIFATAWSTIRFTYPVDDGRVAERLARIQASYADAAGAIAARDGIAGVAAWLHDLRGPGGLPGRHYLVDAALQPIAGRPLPEELAAVLASPGPGAGAASPGVFRDRLPVAGEQVWLITDLRFRHRHGRGPPPWWVRNYARSPGTGFLRLGIAVLVSGIVCYLVARALTRPVRRLRAATAAIAEGDFSARVGARARGGDELARLGRDFDAMAERLQDLVESHRQLVRDVSHELRSPLARLHVALGLARQRGPGEAAGALDRIEQEVEELERLVARLLEVARLESGVSALSLEQVELGALIEAVIARVEFEAPAAAARVELDGPGPVRLRADADLLTSALENIVRNAVRHTPATTPVEITLSVVDGAVHVRVRDHGPGVPAAILPRLFEPFVRAEAARDRDSGGYGIGLAIARAAVERHGGRISASNRPAGGLEIELVLPASSG